MPGGVQSNYPPSYNMAPTDPELIVREREGKRELVEMRWGLVPYWSKDKKGAFKCINARSETVETSHRFAMRL